MFQTEVPKISSEPTRALYPRDAGFAERDGVRLFYEVYGDGEPTVMFLPTWSILHSRFWKAQLPYFGRHFRAVTFDGRGNGRSDRPDHVGAYAPEEFAADAMAVLDATDTNTAVLVGLSLGAQFGIEAAATHPDRVDGLALIGPLAPSGRPSKHALPLALFRAPLPAHPGWLKYNRRYMRRHQRAFLEWFVRETLPEPHSTRPIEDGIEWGLEIDAETLATSADAFIRLGLLLKQRRRVRDIRCPVLVLHGDRDTVNPPVDGRVLARRSGGRFISISGAGHAPHARHPVRVNLELRAFVESCRTREFALSEEGSPV